MHIAFEILPVALLALALPLAAGCGTVSEADLDALVEEARGNPELGLHGGHEDIQAVLDETIAVSHDQLHVRMDAGQNLAAVAKDVGVDPFVVVDALVENASETVDEAVSDGSITADEGKSYVRKLEVAYTERVFYEG